MTDIYTEDIVKLFCTIEYPHSRSHVHVLPKFSLKDHGYVPISTLHY